MINIKLKLKICDMPFLFRFIKLYDNMVDEIMEGDDEILETRQDHHKEFMQTYIDTVKDRGKTSLFIFVGCFTVGRVSNYLARH